jgi:hypothetical protein
MTNDDTGSFNAGWWHCAHRIPLGRPCAPCATACRRREAITGGPQMSYREDQEAYRASLLLQQLEGRDIPPDLSWVGVRALVGALHVAGYDVEPYAPPDGDRACVSVRCDDEAALYALGSYGGAVVVLPGGGGISQITWEEAPWPVSGRDLRDYVGDDT